jgi:tetratricopeptide (TPR) repeat protein
MGINRLPRYLLAAVLALSLSLSGAGGAAAQDKKPEIERKERASMMGERAYRRFESVQTLYSDGEYQEALGNLDAMTKMALNDYEKAMAQQMYGYTYVALENYSKAIPAFEEAIRLDALPNQPHFNLMRALAGLYASREKWQDSVDLMLQYLKYQAEPTAQDQILMAQCYAQMERYREALPWVRGAITTAGPKAQESWYQLEVAIHFETRDFRAAVAVLKTLVARWPQKLKYWEMLAGAYQELNQDQDALSAMMAAYHNGLITDPKKILSVVRMNMYMELPYQGAIILEKAIGGGTVEATDKNLELLLSGWTAAREYGKATAVIDRLAKLKQDGDLYIQKANLKMEQNDWSGTVEAANQALQMGDLDNPGGAWLMKGIAEMELGQLQEAKRSFKQAQQFDDKVRRQARDWEKFVEDRMQVASR